jgi:hypothetical protein
MTTRRTHEVKKIFQIATSMMIAFIQLSCGGSSSLSEKNPNKSWTYLGTFQTTVYPETGETFTEAIDPSSVAQSNISTKNSLANHYKTDLTSANYVAPQNCTPANWNSTTLYVSVDYKLVNLTASRNFANLVLVIIGNDPNYANLHEIYTTDAPGQAILSNLDGNSNGFMDNMYPDISLTAANIETGYRQTSPSVGSDNILSFGESSACKFFQIKLGWDISPAGTTFFYEVWGDEVTGSTPAAPTINAVTTPTNSATQTISGTCLTGSSMSITGGASTATGTCVASAYSILVNLNTNTTNYLSVTQTFGGFTSAPATATIIHDNVSPQVSSSGPVNGETLVSIYENVVVNFNEPMKSSTFVDRTTVFLDRSGTCGAAVINGTISLSGDLTQMVFNPNAALTSNCDYTFQVYGTGQASNAKDLANNSLNTSYSMTFTTAPTTNDKTPPQISSIYVSDNSRDVSKSTFFSVMPGSPPSALTYSCGFWP